MSLIPWRQLSRPLRHYLALSLIRIVWLASFCVSARIWRKLGERFGELVGYFHPKSSELDRRLKSLDLEKPVAVSLFWRDLGRRAFEALRLHRTSESVIINHTPLSMLKEIDQRPVGTLILLPHFGHWEAMGAALVRYGFAFSAISTLGKKDLLNRWIQKERHRNGLRVIDTHHAAHRIVRQLSAGDNVAMFMDVPNKARGYSLPFLGRDVSRSTIANRLVALTGCSCVFVYNLRSHDGQYHVHAEEIPDDVDVIKWSHERLEALISQHAEQWLWLLE